jgi:hypothetical protein
VEITLSRSFSCHNCGRSAEGGDTFAMDCTDKRCDRAHEAHHYHMTYAKIMCGPCAKVFQKKLNGNICCDNFGFCDHPQSAIWNERFCPIHEGKLNSFGYCGDCYTAVIKMQKQWDKEDDERRRLPISFGSTPNDPD